MKQHFLHSVVLLVVFVTACTSEPTTTLPPPTNTPEPPLEGVVEPTAVPEPTETTGSSPVPPADLLGKAWQWVHFTDPATCDTAVVNPEDYQLQFEADGTVFIQADCNTGSGTYSVNEGSISIIVGSMTRAFCGEDSLDAQFLLYLEAAAIWFTQNGDLFFDLKFDSGTMQFTGTAADLDRNSL
jgi:heat shock protein HslJ